MKITILNIRCRIQKRHTQWPSLAVKTTMAVVAVNIVWPCPSGRSWTDCKARAKAIAPRSPIQAQNYIKAISQINNSKQSIKFHYFLPLYQRAFWCFKGIFLCAGLTKFTKYPHEKTFAALQTMIAQTHLYYNQKGRLRNGAIEN